MISALLTALWLGVLTSISPCPLATNIAAISFIGKNVENPLKTLFLGFVYTLGRVLSYVLLGLIVVGGLLSIPSVAGFLTQYINKIIGPLMIIVGVILLDLIRLDFSFGVVKQDDCEKFGKAGFLGAFALGLLFALSFCPVSAGLFFGGVIPLALEHNSKFLLPLVYGLGTGLPVIIFAVVIAFSSNMVGKIYHNLTKFQFWFRKITGGIFILAGIYFILTHYFGFSF